jgi:hypothetical protein
MRHALQHAARRASRGPPKAVLGHICPGADLILPLAHREPVGLLDVLERDDERLDGVRVHQMHALPERRK